jgi:Protein of unknown function (DUF2905)
MDLAQAGRLLLLVGLATASLGLLVWGVSALAPGPKLGRLPGDVVTESGGVRVYIPITTMILASLAVTLIIWLIGVVRR